MSSSTSSSSPSSDKSTTNVAACSSTGEDNAAPTSSSCSTMTTPLYLQQYWFGGPPDAVDNNWQQQQQYHQHPHHQYPPQSWMYNNHGSTTITQQQQQQQYQRLAWLQSFSSMPAAVQPGQYGTTMTTPIDLPPHEPFHHHHHAGQQNAEPTLHGHGGTAAACTLSSTNHMNSSSSSSTTAPSPSFSSPFFGMSQSEQGAAAVAAFTAATAVPVESNKNNNMSQPPPPPLLFSLSGQALCALDSEDWNKGLLLFSPGDAASKNLPNDGNFAVNTNDCAAEYEQHWMPARPLPITRATATTTFTAPPYSCDEPAPALKKSTSELFPRSSTNKQSTEDGKSTGAAPAPATSSKKSAKQRAWTKQEDALLLQAIEQEGTKWTAIATSSKYFDNTRSNAQLKSRWDKKLNPALKQSDWTKEEDATILRCKEHGQSWPEIARILSGRPPEKIRDRFSQIDPTLDKTPLTAEEKAIIKEAVEQYSAENKKINWKEIVKLLPGRRSTKQAKNCWNNFKPKPTKKRTLQDIDEEMKKQEKPHAQKPRTADPMGIPTTALSFQCSGGRVVHV